MNTMLQWKIRLSEETVFLGAEPFRNGRVLVTAELPEGHLSSCAARVLMPTSDRVKIFMNGYQSWTNCPEYTKTDRIRGLNHLPKSLVDKFSLDRYSDYHFMKYPDRRGYTHGFSYCYFRKDERFFLIGSLDERPGYTMFMYNANREILTIRRDCEGVRCGGAFSAFDLFLAEGTEEEVFDAYFEALGIRCRTKEKIAGYSSWYNRYQDISELSILEDMRGAKEVLSPGDLFQIDDGWEPFIGDWLMSDRKKFPNGMKAAADMIHDAGFRAGLWLAPFIAEEDSRLFKEHPDWFIFRDGMPWKAGCNWSGFYALDFDRQEVTDYLRESFRQVFDVWGYDLVKLDFLYAAAPFGTEEESRAARMMRAVDLLRELCGEKLILGCGVPLFPAFGKVDYCRVSCDVSLDDDDKLWMRLAHRERPSTKHAIATDTVRRHLNGRAFGNDPDVFFLRTENLSMSGKRKRELAETCALYGNVLFTSDNMSVYNEKQRAEYRRIRTIFEERP
ncbi:MAG: alpha-galactosidase [Lachnospiraceae bacterium]|nr:alpha-galactosidase [Lachnospiraceae bacterium]